MCVKSRRVRAITLGCSAHHSAILRFSAVKGRCGGADFSMSIMKRATEPIDRPYPLRVFVITLLVIFCAEIAVMTMLPLFLRPTVDWRGQSIIDAALLTGVVAPVLWLLIIGPLRRVVHTRTELLSHVIEAQERERRRIARDLHDEVGQSLTSLLLGLRTVAVARTRREVRQRVGELRDATAAALREVRRLARGLRPSVLDDLGLGAALERLAEDQAAAVGVAVTVDAKRLNGERLPEAIEITLYRIAQEALTNVARHAGAKSARIVVARQPKRVSLAVEDDGQGFDSTSVLREHGSLGTLGISGMRERAVLLGGGLSIESSEGRGTRVKIWLPLPEASHGEDSNTTGR